MALHEEDSLISKLNLACSDLKTLLQASSKIEDTLEKMDKKFDVIDESLSTSSRIVAPLHSLAMAAKALETRINRAVSPALALLDSFKLCESLQQKLLEVSSQLSADKNPKKRLKLLLKLVDCVDKLNAVINTISENGEPVIQKLQEVVEFLSRTKATVQYRAYRLRETLVTLKILYETEIDTMKFDGLLDEALLNLQDEHESILQKLKHHNIDESQGGNKLDMADSDLGTELEIEVLRRISETLAANDCLDICIDIYVKVRYVRAAKALMRLNPDYLKTYTPEEIDEMEWGTLETAISLWIQHFELALRTVFVSEKKLSNQILRGILDGAVWLECFVKIADKIMAVFFRFGEGVARSNKEPQKLFKLLDMFDSLEKLKTEFSEIFEGEAGADICTRFRELEKLLVHSSSKVFWEFGLQIEGNSDGFPPPQDSSVPKLVRYAVNYLKYLASETYSAPMAKVLLTEKIWKAGILSKPEPEEHLLRDAITNIMEALQRNVESKKLRYKDRILPHVFAMNTYWYIYMRTRNTDLGKLLGEQYLKMNYKVVAEESAYMYQRQAWKPLVRLLDKEELKRENKSENEDTRALIREKMEGFLKGVSEVSQRHRSGSYTIHDVDLREQIKEATVNLVVPAYIEFLNAYSSALPSKSYVKPEAVQGLLDQIFNGSDGKLKRRDSKHRTRGGTSSSFDVESKDLRRLRSYTSDM
ncbi:PREDICTED: exocyst complex component EXO70A1-like [Populus euphratica]|uniref:Exocyst subunit Exo70 family protein n=1 Tax=Populus euphratica TaxID=75702 RepID=A0AAJ6SWI1_POPEU|nr:PREDICTED: exocyst complex component EXO70A1-like [Populus euphratica]